MKSIKEKKKTVSLSKKELEVLKGGNIDHFSRKTDTPPPEGYCHGEPDD